MHDRRWHIFNLVWLATVVLRIANPNRFTIALEHTFLAVAVARMVYLLVSWIIEKVREAKSEEDAKIEELAENIKMDRSSFPAHDVVTCIKCNQSWVASKTVRDEQIKAAMRIYLHECKGGK